MCQKAIGMAFDTIPCCSPLSRQHLIKTPDPSRQHQGVAGEAEPVGFGVGSFGGRGERRERIAPRAARVTSVSPLTGRGGIGGSGRGEGQRSSPATGCLLPGEDDPGEGGEEIEDGFKEVHDL